LHLGFRYHLVVIDGPTVSVIADDDDMSSWSAVCFRGFAPNQMNLRSLNYTNPVEARATCRGITDSHARPIPAFIRDSRLSSVLWQQVWTSAAVGAQERAGPSAV
jgi:hypothetical protein